MQSYIYTYAKNKHKGRFCLYSAFIWHKLIATFAVY